jgi:hypothetical protein
MENENEQIICMLIDRIISDAKFLIQQDGVKENEKMVLWKIEQLGKTITRRINK